MGSCKFLFTSIKSEVSISSQTADNFFVCSILAYSPNGKARVKLCRLLKATNSDRASLRSLLKESVYKRKFACFLIAVCNRPSPMLVSTPVWSSTSISFKVASMCSRSANLDWLTAFDIAVCRRCLRNFCLMFCAVLFSKFVSISCGAAHSSTLRLKRNR